MNHFICIIEETANLYKVFINRLYKLFKSHINNNFFIFIKYYPSADLNTLCPYFVNALCLYGVFLPGVNNK
jgi:hypothetical protein